MTLRLAAIVRLFGVCRPSDVAVFVIPIIVWETIQRVRTARTRTHIVEECEKGISPTVAHGNPATAIVLERGILRALATVDHGAPDPELGCASASVDGSPLSQLVDAVTPARLHGSTREYRCAHRDGDAAVTSTDELTVSAFALRCFFNDDQSRKALADCNVYAMAASARVRVAMAKLSTGHQTFSAARAAAFVQQHRVSIVVTPFRSTEYRPSIELRAAFDGRRPFRHAVNSIASRAA